ncbi:nucleotidyltransferase family protein [Clostridium sp. Marseille-P299]|uniref:nucleotidyltransferase family protein n=1 Tax=Clostridium sp. Marseille-P299 TaxID=1805477 RepID=UPI00083284D1|nr:sugar phosphate nucleotidyltransferase [Clostridium sp. Marseille-P299]
MNKTALVIMAAGIGSRYGGGIKQLEHVGPSGEIIMDYSIYDAIQAGFDKVVFIIRRDLEKDFKEIIGNRIEKQIEVEYVYQELDALPNGFTKPEERVKPWGTGQAVLCCKDVIKEPFAVINADDYYGKEAFVKVHDYLANADVSSNDKNYCMAGFVLGNTLSDNGIVTRGVCKVDDNQFLTSVEETFAIEREGDVAVGKNGAGEKVTLDLNSSVSMNMWGFTPNFLNELETGFVEFLKGISAEEIKAEYLLPEVVGKMLREERATVKVLKTNDKWFGVTYKEDKELVVNSINSLVAEGKYPAKLFQDK